MRVANHRPPTERPGLHEETGPLLQSLEPAASAATAGGAAALTDVAATGRPHLRAAGEAQGAVDRRTGDRLHQLGGSVRTLGRLLRRSLSDRLRRLQSLGRGLD